MISFTVFSVPVAQPRQRHAIRGVGSRQFVSNYTPSTHPVNAFKAHCQLAAKQAHPGAPMEGPMRLSIVAVFPRPTAKIWKKRPMPREYKVSKPDFDNLAKSVCDALTGVIWRDDALIADAQVVKLIASGSEGPSVKISVESIAWVWDEIKF